MAGNINEFIKWGDYNQCITDLADKALLEKWSFGNSNDYSILKNYLNHTFKKVKEEHKIKIENDYCVFDTGLFTKFYEPIYVYSKMNKSEGKWEFSSYCTSYELGNIGIYDLPSRADYFTKPELLVFDWRRKVNVQYKHILEDDENRKRLPESIKTSDAALEILKGMIDTSINRVIANYRLAIPQYYNGNIQLLLPLLYGKQDKPVLALVITYYEGGYYQGHTCLTIEMAYNNARLIARPENNWLEI